MSDQPMSSSRQGCGADMQQSEDVVITALRAEHTNAVVDLHMQAFPDFFLTFLGRSFLRQMYLCYQDDPATIALVASRKTDDEILGAVIGPLQVASFYKRILVRRWWRFALAALGAVLRRPSVVPRLLRAVRYRGDAPVGETDRALLASIAVSPAAQGMGVGKLLTMAFLAKVREAGLPGAYLTTDAENNDVVNAFYRRQGWKVESRFTTPEKRKMLRYVYDF